MSEEKLPNIHPGEILREEFMVPLGLSVYHLAKATCLPLETIDELYHEKHDITPTIAVSLSKHLGTSVEFWLNLQTLFDECDQDRR